ncbi:hypothetical protein [Roseateles saccharophilus]|uniref:Uncharacterized protein n=1 Tax=Roseateles saccharophilus TaxID=304 RepID=A0A4R3U7A2_ROSSA|nr:hypothetical protein [Roseateles saccharophilus]MDG0836175.1 hypothetical protein [Roseateles saccharophilus]TCU81735.1 hypothetical protein EV671_10722 [Roseateles saccharophilus]
MSTPRTFFKTRSALQLLAGPRGTLAVPRRMLLINVDGKRGVPELLEIARALGLGADALHDLQRDGLIDFATEPARASTAPAPRSLHPPAAVAAISPGPSEDLRRLVRAKLFAVDLAGRMLAGRDFELRARAREVDSESRFLDWLADASNRIEAAADAERAQLFRERVAQAAS